MGKKIMRLNGIKMCTFKEFLLILKKKLDIFIDVEKMLNFGICKHYSAHFINFFIDKINYFVLHTIKCRS